eukprot:s1929_g12.t1
MTQSNMRSLARAVGLVACICAPLTSGTEVFHSIGTQACKTGDEDLTNLLQIIPDWQQLSHESHEGQHVHEGQHSHEGQGHAHGHAKNGGKAGVAGVTSRRISQTQQSAQLHEHGAAQTNNSGNATSSSATASCVDLIHQCRNDFDWNSCVGFESRCYNAAKAVQLIQVGTQQSQASAPVVRTNLDCDTWSLRCQSQDWTACLYFEDHCQQASPRPRQLSLAFASSSLSQPTFQSARRVEEGQDCESLISQRRSERPHYEGRGTQDSDDCMRSITAARFCLADCTIGDFEEIHPVPDSNGDLLHRHCTFMSDNILHPTSSSLSSSRSIFILLDHLLLYIIMFIMIAIIMTMTSVGIIKTGIVISIPTPSSVAFLIIFTASINQKKRSKLHDSFEPHLGCGALVRGAGGAAWLDNPGFAHTGLR